MGRVAMIIVASSRLVGAQTVAAPSCLDEDNVVVALERIVDEFGERTLRVRAEQTICSDTLCVVHFDLSPRSPECSSDFRYSPAAPSKPQRPQIAAFVCETPRDECPPSAFTECVRRAMAMVSETTRCPRVEPISDPVAPPPAPPARTGFDLGLGARLLGDEALQRPLLAVGASIDWKIATWLTGGARFGYVAAAGNAFDRDGDGSREADARNYHALESAARMRVRLGDASRRLELETALGHRLTLAGATPSHLTIGAGPIVYFSRFGLGLQYVRALADVGQGHALFLTTQRNTPLDVEGETWHDARQRRGPRVGLGMHLILTGWGFAEHAGPMLPGAAIELPVLIAEPLVAVARYDFLWFPALDAPAFVAQTVLGGLQYLHLGSLPVGIGALAGYTVVDGKSPRIVDGGPVVDGGVFYWLDQLGVHLGLHGRLGLASQNQELRAVYASLGARQIF